MKEVKLKVPDEFFVLWDSEEDALEEIKKLFILGLVWKKKLSQGKGAELLGMNRWDFMDLLAEYNVPVLDIEDEEPGSGMATLRDAKALNF